MVKSRQKMPKYVAVLLVDGRLQPICKKVHKHWPKKTAEKNFVFGVLRPDGVSYEAVVWKGLGACPRVACVAQELLDSCVESVCEDKRLQSLMRHPARSGYVLTT